MRIQLREIRKTSQLRMNSLAHQSGAILVIALLALVVLSVLGLALTTISKTESDISYNDRDSSRALYIADAGFERFKRDLRYQVTYPGTDATWRYLASPAPAGDGTSGPDTTGTYVKSTAPVKRYYDLGAPLATLAHDPPTISDWTLVSDLSAYLQTSLNGGRYTLKVGKNSMDEFLVRSTGSVRSRVARTLEVKYEAKNLSVWDNAIFGGAGASGAVINGNCTIAGSVHILGNGLASNDTALSLRGRAGVINDYAGISSTLNPLLVQKQADIAARPGKLRAEYRCKRGITSTSGSGSIGVSGTNIKGVYTNDGFASGAAVYSDNGKNQKYDLPSDISFPFPLPDTANPPLSTALDITATLPLNGTNRKLDSSTASFGPISDANGNSIRWDQAGATLYLTGVVKVNASLDLAKKDSNLYYSGKGTIYCTGTVYIHEYTLPAANDSFPTIDCLGVIAGVDIEMATGSGESQILVAGAFYAQNKIKSNKQTQTAGTWVSNYFDLGSQVPIVYQVPLLGRNLPPGMPGGDPYFFIKTVYWKEIT